MLENVFKILDNAQKLDEKEAFRLAVNDEAKKLIIELNTEVQLGKQGIDSEEDSLGEYAAFTINERSSLGLQVGHVDFKVTGEYWNSWKVDVVGDEILISVDKDRYDELVEDLRFSDTHVGLTDENIGILANKMLESYREYAINRILA